MGGVVVFLPQILILFAFILALEESGYLPRAAFLLDRMMAAAGLSGRSFIPLLSSFACAIPASWPRAASRTRATAWPRSSSRR
jgi:ferrous iron transport protein B